MLTPGSRGDKDGIVVDFLTTHNVKIFFPKTVLGETLYAAFEAAAGNCFLAEPDWEIGEKGHMLSVDPAISRYSADCAWDSEILMFTGMDFNERIVTTGRGYNCVRLGIKLIQQRGLIPVSAGSETINSKEALVTFGNTLIARLCELDPSQTAESITELTRTMRTVKEVIVRWECPSCNMGIHSNIGGCPHCGASVKNAADLWLPKNRR